MKGHFGRTFGAAGVRFLQAMGHNLVPASLGFESPGVGAQIHVIAKAGPLPVRAVVTLKTGFGGRTSAEGVRRGRYGPCECLECGSGC